MKTVWREMGENDALIVEKLAADPNMFGIFGFSFFDQNRDKVQASIMDGVELNFDNVHPTPIPAHALFFYVRSSMSAVSQV